MRHSCVIMARFLRNMWWRYLRGAAASRPRRRADRGGVAALAAGRGDCPSDGLSLAAVDNFTHLRGLWIARKSLISFITYAQLTKNTAHDLHYVKSKQAPSPCFAAFLSIAMRKTSICG